MSVSFDPALAAEVEKLTRKIIGTNADAEMQELARHLAETQIDLRRVRDQGLVADLEVLAALNPGGDLVWRTPPGFDLLFLFFQPLGDPLRIRRLQPAPEHLVVQRHQPGLVEGEEVVELQRLPRLAAIRVTVRM